MGNRNSRNIVGKVANIIIDGKEYVGVINEFVVNSDHFEFGIGSVTPKKEEEQNKPDREIINAEHIIELSKTVAKLQRQVDRMVLSDRRSAFALNEIDRQVDSNTKDIRTWAESTVQADYKAGQALTSSRQFAEVIENQAYKSVDYGRIVGTIVRDEETTQEHDVVNSPSHYTQGDIEVIDYIDQVTAGYSGKQAVYVGNVIKYVSRAPHKNGVQDLEKASWYLTRLIDAGDSLD